MRILRLGDEVVVSRLDHDANIAPWIAAAEDAGARVKWIDFDTSDCTIDLESLDAALSERTRICSFTLASNAVGTVTPAAEIVRRVRNVCDAIVIRDAVHLLPIAPSTRAISISSSAPPTSSSGCILE